MIITTTIISIIRIIEFYYIKIWHTVIVQENDSQAVLLNVFFEWIKQPAASFPGTALSVVIEKGLHLKY